MNEDQVVDGFSSDQQLKEEQIFVQDKPSTSPTHNHKEQLKYKIPPAAQIKDKPYPLHPDIASGWVPRILLPNPIPLIYQNRSVDLIVRQLLHDKKSQYKIVYLGPRYENSYFIHYGKPYDFPYSHIRPPEKIKFTNRAFLGNNPDFCEDLNFDSLFESGNLDCAVWVGPFQYDLFIQVDSNTKGHLQWYNFKVTKTRKGSKYRFNICNFQKSKSLYTRGMKPFVLSKRRNEAHKSGWEQVGDNLTYEAKPFRYRSSYDQRYYRLSFEYTFQYDSDEVQFAYCVPYDYSQLTNWIGLLGAKSGSYLKVGKLCTSLGGLDVPLLTIHEEDKRRNTQHLRSINIHGTSQIDDGQLHFQSCHQQSIEFPTNAPKKCIIISGRAHPGESNGSFMMQGFLEFICGPSLAAQYLRKRVIFKVVPMLNPDGVVAGNYRTGLSGRDFNRQFLNPDRFIFPEIIALKDLVIKCKRQFKNNLLLFLDFHGHSIKKNVFMYGPEFPITERYYYQSKILPKLLSKHTQMFRYYSCIFRISSFKQTTARAILLKKLDIPFSYTIEASNGSFYNKEQMKDIKFSPKLWIEMGVKIGQTLHQYCSALIAAEQTRMEKARERQVIMNKKKRSLLETKRISKFTTERPLKRKVHIDISPRKEQIILSEVGILKQIIEEIKESDTQQAKKLDAISDDALSQGSSDREKQTDDLAPDKMKRLYKMINCKKFQGFENLKINEQNTFQNTDLIESEPQILSPSRLLSSKSNPHQQKQMCQSVISTPNQSSVNLINIFINSDGQDLQNSPGEQLPPIQVFTNRGRVTVRQKPTANSRNKSPGDAFFDTVRHRPTAKISNISFSNPFWQDGRRVQGTPNPRQRAQSCAVVHHNSDYADSLRRTYHIYKQANKVYSGFPPDSSRQLARQLEWKSRIRNERKSVNYTAIYMNR